MESDEKMSKLRTYKLVKNKFGTEKYLELNERNLRKSLAAFRISAHKLNIERGRYLNEAPRGVSAPRIPENNALISPDP